MAIKTGAEYASNALETVRALIGGRSDLSGAEIVIRRLRNLNLEARDGALESFRRHESFGLGVRLQRGGKTAQSYGSQLEMQDLKALIARCDEMLEHVPDEDSKDPIAPLEFDGDAQLGLDMVDPTFDLVDAEEKINRTLNLEANVLRADPRIKRSRGTQYSEGHFAEWLWTLGSKKTLMSQKTHGSLAAGAVAEENGESQIGYDSASETHYYDLNWGGVAKNAASLGLKLLGAKPLPSNRYGALFPNYVAVQLVSLLSSAFSGENVAQGLSFLDAKCLGKELFSPEITLVDDPHQKKRLGTAYWDTEGVPTQRIVLADQGSPLAFVHNRKSASLMKSKTTGNAKRLSEKSAPGVGFHNLMIEPGKKDFVDLLRDMNKGIMVCKILGLHTANPVTGDFSFGISGLSIENGEEQGAVSGMTLSGSLRELFSKVVSIGRDIKWHGNFASPSLVCGELTFSGGR